MKSIKSIKASILFAILLLTTLCLTSCGEEDKGCETETVCFGDNNCVERPIPGTCF